MSGRSREELVPELRKLAAWLPALHPDKEDEASALIREAADLLDSLEERWRVVDRNGMVWHCRDRAQAEGLKVSIATQRRLTTPWTDVEEPSND